MAEDDQRGEPQHKEGSPARALLPAGIGGVAIWGAWALGEALSFDTLSTHREALLAYRDDHYLLTALAFMGAYVTIVAFSLPGATVATLTGGFLFGVFPGVVFNVLAAGTGACLIFLAARWGLGGRLARRMEQGERTKKLKQGIDANMWPVLFLMRVIPVVPFFAANLIPALLAVPLPVFAVTTYLGIIPGAIVYTSVGAGLGEVFAAGGRPDLSLLREPRVFLPFVGLALLASLPLFRKAFLSRWTR
ncbi:TVP38/TMEM64 family protein [Pseudoroseicyclus tamaricis]|uniref:TVP38/TMEM64 family membrane protein n=1 Tax=Pseudoroseicyclus tamaricis TaxID=2705421 RepID=A0A6B2K2P0_9RHOB|nr:TVP38/TMEM64 family protein [Pseudoroseicyclus tamaricis]NDV02042.1 TVP38/TMEM64 family protein [Pseudoroseicyclus tamaricis]